MGSSDCRQADNNLTIEEKRFVTLFLLCCEHMLFNYVCYHLDFYAECYSKIRNLPYGKSTILLRHARLRAVGRHSRCARRVAPLAPIFIAPNGIPPQHEYIATDDNLPVLGRFLPLIITFSFSLRGTNEVHLQMCS